MMTPQEVFDRVAVHLIVQGRKSVGWTLKTGTICMYRSDGCKCAAGALISDDDYDISMEGMSVFSSSVAEALATTLGVPGFAADARECSHYGRLLDALQVCHDDTDVERWPRALRKIAFKHALSDAATWAPI